jgi:uncharacterized membrane protein YfcA
MGIYLLLGFLGAVCGFFSGLLGIGGGIIMAPLLLYIPPILGFQPFSMQTVSGLTIVQGLVACLSGVIAHKRFNVVSMRLAAWMGTVIFITALVGGVLSKFTSNNILLFIFGILALLAAILLFLPGQEQEKHITVSELSFSYWRAMVSAGGVGIFGGMVGQGGSFILIPLMTGIVKIPTRIALGSNLAIVLLSTTAGFIGKTATGQIEWLLTLPIVLTVVPAAQLGSVMSHMVAVPKLRKILGVLIAAASFRILIAAVFN